MYICKVHRVHTVYTCSRDVQMNEQPPRLSHVCKYVVCMYVCMHAERPSNAYILVRIGGPRQRRQTDRQAGRQADRQAGRQAGEAWSCSARWSRQGSYPRAESRPTIATWMRLHMAGEFRCVRSRTDVCIAQCRIYLLKDFRKISINIHSSLWVDVCVPGVATARRSFADISVAVHAICDHWRYRYIHIRNTYIYISSIR
jgi:hypothetical protein